MLPLLFNPTVRRVILPACSIAAGRRIEQGVSIIDLSGLGKLTF